MSFHSSLSESDDDINKNKRSSFELDDIIESILNIYNSLYHYKVKDLVNVIKLTEVAY